MPECRDFNHCKSEPSWALVLRTERGDRDEGRIGSDELPKGTGGLAM